jgi:hypothetical protein
MKSCFVIQGYGRKTDYRDGRVLDLDASYAIIKDAVEAAGLECIRADEIQHSGTIDLPMYQWLLNADLVVADLSTNNSNAVFELGVRYALRPHATIIVAEEQFQNPFDFSHIAIRRYKHLGEDIGAKEARRFRDELKAAIQAIAAERRIDSPIYTFLPTLRPPVDQKALDEEALAPFAPVPTAMPAATEQLPPLSTLLTRDGSADTEAVDLNTKQLLEQAQKRINDSDFASARVLLDEARKRRPTDSFVIQRLALAIYKSKQPDPMTALNDALEVLRVLKPETCNNPETLGLYGAIHKRLWEINPKPQLLDIGITAYARGFALKQDHYTGINFAFLLDLRARASQGRNARRRHHRPHVGPAHAQGRGAARARPPGAAARGTRQRAFLGAGVAVGGRAGHRRHGSDGRLRGRAALDAGRRLDAGHLAMAGQEAARAARGVCGAVAAGLSGPAQRPPVTSITAPVV